MLRVILYLSFAILYATVDAFRFFVLYCIVVCCLLPIWWIKDEYNRLLYYFKCGVLRCFRSSSYCRQATNSQTDIEKKRHG